MRNNVINTVFLDARAIMGKRNPACSAWVQGREVGSKDRRFKNMYFNLGHSAHFSAQLPYYGIPNKGGGKRRVTILHLDG